MRNYIFREPFLITAYLMMLLVTFMLPYYSMENYSILQNTTSKLGAQQTPNAWVMNVTFIALGLAAIITGWNYLGDFWFHRAILVIFGMSLVCVAFFQSAPIDHSVAFDAREDDLHALFATITGSSFVLFTIAIAGILKNKQFAAISIIIGLLAAVLSLMIFRVDSYAGIWQRMIFILSFGWMIWLFGESPRPAQ